MDKGISHRHLIKTSQIVPTMIIHPVSSLIEIVVHIIEDIEQLLHGLGDILSILSIYYLGPITGELLEDIVHY